MSAFDFKVLHHRYSQLLRLWDGTPRVITMSSEEENAIRQKLSRLFGGMMRALYEERGATLRISLLTDEPVSEFISEHAATLDNAMANVAMSNTMRAALSDTNYVFSGMKAFCELGEAFPSLIAEDGTRKTFERFLSDVRHIDTTYNQNYLRAEFNFVTLSATAASQWESFDPDESRYLLQYRTVGDNRVRPEHAAMHGITLPQSDPFWDVYFPPNGWNCRCSVAQVRAEKFPQTNPAEARERAKDAMQRDKKGMFRFNPGKERKSVPDYNPYTSSSCRTCKKKGKLAAPNNDICRACQVVCRLSKEKAKLNKEQWQQLNDKKNNLLKDKEQFTTSTATRNVANLQTKVLRYNSYSRKTIIEHCYNDRQFNAAQYIWTNPEKLEYIGNSP